MNTVWSVWLKALMMTVRAASGRSTDLGRVLRDVAAADVLQHAGGAEACAVGEQLAVEDRAEDGDAEGAADGAKERGRCGRRTELGVGHGVLDRDDEDLHDEPETEADHEHVDGGEAVGGSAGRVATAGTRPIAVTPEPMMGKIL